MGSQFEGRRVAVYLLLPSRVYSGSRRAIFWSLDLYLISIFNYGTDANTWRNKVAQKHRLQICADSWQTILERSSDWPSMVVPIVHSTILKLLKRDSLSISLWSHLSKLVLTIRYPTSLAKN